MRVIVALRHRFERTPDGAVWTIGQFAHSFWTRYLSVFDHVRVVARVRHVSEVPQDWQRADGEGVTFASVPYYVGPWQYLLRARRVHGAVRNAMTWREAVVLRIPSQVASCVEAVLRKRSYPYGAEVVIDPYDVFAPGSVEHPLRPVFRWWFSRRLRRQCVAAAGVAYVTAEALQRRYPPSARAFSTHYSSVELPDSAFVSAPRAPIASNGPFRVITVCGLNYLTKGPDVLIDAVGACVQQGLDLNLILVGSGRCRAGLEARAAALGLGERAHFRGQLPSGEAVRKQLDRADLFVLPSRAEGLSRAMIEAMARGLPCIGSTVGGVPELLAPDDLVPPGDVGALAGKIREVWSDPQRLARMSRRNLDKAREYGQEVLQHRRDEFYRDLLRRTEEWQRARGLAAQGVEEVVRD
jgi:glycosyltransferase involved in cell wall biosynthesis